MFTNEQQMRCLRRRRNKNANKNDRFLHILEQYKSKKDRINKGLEEEKEERYVKRIHLNIYASILYMCTTPGKKALILINEKFNLFKLLQINVNKFRLRLKRRKIKLCDENFYVTIVNLTVKTIKIHVCVKMYRGIYYIG